MNDPRLKRKVFRPAWSQIPPKLDHPNTNHFAIKKDFRKRFKIVWYNIPKWLLFRQDALYSGFETCDYKNCLLSTVPSDTTVASAVIFTNTLLPKKMPPRKNGQIWIISEFEPTIKDNIMYGAWESKADVFNWTMSYEKRSSDIHLPYGNVKKTAVSVDKDFLGKAKKKNKTALTIMSRCNSPAKRQVYINKLKKYVDVDILGRCGKKWDCGKRLMHNHCFKIINDYKFYLAFEDCFCNEYFTEKIFENFNYDSILVVRGGFKGQIKEVLPKGTYIDAGDFKTSKALGDFLSSMTTESYAKLLETKYQYQSESYPYVFRNAMCDVCQRLNNMDLFSGKEYKPTRLQNFTKTCVNPNDLG